MLKSLVLLTSLAPQGPGQLVLSDATRNLPTLGITVRDVHMLDYPTGRILRRTTNAVTGTTVDADALVADEAEARDLRHGKIWHVLRQRIRIGPNGQPSETTLVRILDHPERGHECVEVVWRATRIAPARRRLHGMPKEEMPRGPPGFVLVTEQVEQSDQLGRAEVRNEDEIALIELTPSPNDLLKQLACIPIERSAL